jgi:hypothetical protein
MDEDTDNMGVDAIKLELERQIRDAQIEREKYEQQISDNRKLVSGCHKDVFFPGDSDRTYFAVNRIQNAVVTQTAVQTESPPRPVFVGRETNEPPVIFLKPESAYKLRGLEGNPLTSGQMQGIEPLDEAIYGMMAEATVTQKQPNPRAGETVPGEPDAEGNQADVPVPDEIDVQVPIFNDDDFLFLTDELCAEALTQEHEAQWEVIGGDEVVSRWIFNTNVEGWYDGLIQWDADENHFTVNLLYPYDCWIDRWASGMRDAQYFIIRRIMDCDAAKREYPEYADEIESSAGEYGLDNQRYGATGGKYNYAHDRRVVTRTTRWWRNQPIDMTPEEAVESGQIVEAKPTFEDVDGVAVQVDPPFPYLGMDGEPTNPGDEAWPKKMGIRQTDMIGDVVLYDGETEFADIPVARNVNIPVVESPYGIGEPQRLADLNDLYNRLWGIFYDHALYYRSPEQLVPESAMEALKSELSTLHAKGGRKIGLPDDLWQAFNGMIVNTVQPPTMGDTFFRILSMLKEEMDTMSGVVDVMRGEAKSEWRSGAMVDSLTNNARGPMGYKARHTSFALRYAAKISAQLIIDYLPLEVWSERNRKYPPQILQAMRDRLKRFGFDVSVEVSGASSKDSKASKLNNALANNPALLDSQTFMQQWADASEISDAEKIVREVAEARMAAAASGSGNATAIQ